MSISPVGPQSGVQNRDPFKYGYRIYRGNQFCILDLGMREIDARDAIAEILASGSYTHAWLTHSGTELEEIKT